MTPTAHAAANETEVAAALMTANVSSVSIRTDVRNITAIDEATIAADDTATETPIRASIYDAGNVTAAAAAAVTTDRVIVVPAESTIHARLSQVRSNYQFISVQSSTIVYVRSILAASSITNVLVHVIGPAKLVQFSGGDRSSMMMTRNLS